jgi:Protein of unknown function (DUF1393).
MACDAVPHPLPPGMREGISFSLRWHSLPSKEKGGAFFMESRIRKMAYTGLFTAISVILTRFFAGNVNILGVFALRLSFGEVPIMLSGILLGPVYGIACGAFVRPHRICHQSGWWPLFSGIYLNICFNRVNPRLDGQVLSQLLELVLCNNHSFSYSRSFRSA